MRAVIERLIQQYGTTATITSQTMQRTVKVFLQLVTSKSWQNMERMVPAGGEILRGQFLLIVPPGEQLFAADTVAVGDRVFIVRRADAIWLRDKRLFYWGLCVEGGGEDPWTSS